MKNKIATIYVSTLSLSVLYFIAYAFDKNYAFWEGRISTDKFSYFAYVTMMSVPLIILFFWKNNLASKKDKIYFILTLLAFAYLLVNIYLYPYIRMFAGTKLTMLLFAFGFLPSLIITSYVIYKIWK